MENLSGGSGLLMMNDQAAVGRKTSVALIAAAAEASAGRNEVAVSRAHSTKRRSEEAVEHCKTIETNAGQQNKMTVQGTRNLSSNHKSKETEFKYENYDHSTLDRQRKNSLSDEGMLEPQQETIALQEEIPCTMSEDKRQDPSDADRNASSHRKVRGGCETYATRQISLLEKRVEELQTEKQKLEGALVQEKVWVSEHHIAIQQLRVELQKEQQKTLNARTKTQRLKEQLDQEISNSINIKLSAERMQISMENKELFIGVQSSDHKVQEQFKQLMQSLRTWATNFREDSSLPDLVVEDKETFAEFEIVAPGCLTTSLTAFWKSERRRKLFIRGWAALVMTKTILSQPQGDDLPTGDWWMGSALRRSVALIEDELSAAGEYTTLTIISMLTTEKTGKTYRFDS